MKSKFALHRYDSTPSVVILKMIGYINNLWRTLNCKIILGIQITGDGPAKDILVQAFAYISVFIK
jgi:hypothetical protein